MTAPDRWWERHREVMPAQAAPFPCDLPTRLARHNPVWYGESAFPGYWTLGAPLGNGDFGALVYGGPDNLTFLLGKNDCWIRATEKSHFPGAGYADIHRIYKTADRDAFTRLLPSDPDWQDTFRPSTATNAGVFRLHLAEAASTDNVTQELSLFDATWHAGFQVFGLDNMWPKDDAFDVMAFVSAPDEVLVIRVRRQRRPLRSFTWRLNRERHEQIPAATVGGEGALVWLDQALLKGDRYAIALLQTGVQADITYARRSVVGESATDEGRETIFYLAAASRRDSPDPRELACRRVTDAARRGVDALHEAHRRYWAEQWGRAWVSCAEDKVERAWYVSNYLAGSTLRPDKVSPGLQGMWIKENAPPWSADFHGNVNIQAVYQGIMGSNRMDLFEPYVRLYHAMLPQCRKDTRAYFQADGARLPHAGSIEGYEIAEWNWPALAASIAPSAWIARLFWWAYLHILDSEFLIHKAYPMLRDVALFYQSMLALGGKGPDGRHRLEPSIYGEAHATELDGWGTDSLYDIVSMRMAFQQAADAADAAGLDSELARAWREALRDLPPLPADASGIWLQFQDHPRNARVTAASWCYPIFPGEVASLFHGSELEQNQAKATWTYARTLTASPWCGGCPTAAAARMGDAEWALRSASELSNNGLTCGRTGGIMQAEHGTGMSLAFNSMALLAVEGTLILFPGMPARTDAAFHSLRAPGAVLVSAEQRDGRVVHAAFQALKGGTLRVLNPYDPSPTNRPYAAVEIRRLDTDARIQRVACRWREPVEWEAEPAVVYRLFLAD
jgi:hypothetical protein